MSQLIPRDKLFGNPQRVGLQISPNGENLAWIAPKDGVLNVWIAPLEFPDEAAPVTDDRHRGIRFYTWSKAGDSILYFQDRDGDENWQMFRVAVADRQEINLTPYEEITTRLHALSWDHPNTAVIGLNDRDKSWHDVYSVDLKTGERTLLFQNDGGFGNFHVDRGLNLRLAERTLEEGGREIFRFRADGSELEKTDFIRIPHEDDLTTGVAGFTRDGEDFYWLSSLKGDKAGLYRKNFASGEETVIGQHAKANVSQLLVHPTSFKVEAYGANHIQLEWAVVDESVSADFEFLQSELSGELQFLNRNAKDDLWIVTRGVAESPNTSYLYRRTDKQLVDLGSDRPELRSYSLHPMNGVVINSRDGLELVSYLTLPNMASKTEAAREEETPFPMVLLVHGGPWARDGYGFNPSHQWLANRGYAVLSVNFRGSSGFGKEFINAGDLEWGRRMHDDLIDAVNWAVAQGVADKDRIAIMGGSYGGYAALAGLTFTPETFACGVDIVGPSNLQTLIETIPPYWKSFFENFARRMGDPRTEEGRQLLAERSPLNHVDKICRPLLIAQGANDPRVKQAESDQIVEAMQAKGRPVTYVLYPDEGHGFARPENRLSFYAITEQFLSLHLGGEAEPIGEALEPALLEVPEGGEHIPGLKN